MQEFIYENGNDLSVMFLQDVQKRRKTVLRLIIQEFLYYILYNRMQSKYQTNSRFALQNIFFCFPRLIKLMFLGQSAYSAIEYRYVLIVRMHCTIYFTWGVNSFYCQLYLVSFSFFQIFCVSFIYFPFIKLNEKNHKR